MLPNSNSSDAFRLSTTPRNVAGEPVAMVLLGAQVPHATYRSVTAGALELWSRTYPPGFASKDAAPSCLRSQVRTRILIWSELYPAQSVPASQMIFFPVPAVTPSPTAPVTDFIGML